MPTLPSLDVLVADPDKDNAECMSLWLEVHGYRVSMARDGISAYQIAREIRPHAIVAELDLPHLNGFDLCTRLRQLPWADSLIAVTLTAWTGQHVAREAHRAGFDAFLAKPADPRQIVSLLQGRAAKQTRRMLWADGYWQQRIMLQHEEQPWFDALRVAAIASDQRTSVLPFAFTANISRIATQTSIAVIFDGCPPADGNSLPGVWGDGNQPCFINSSA